MTEFLPRANVAAVDSSGRFTRETYDALRRTIAALNDADAALSERQRETLAILNALGADDVESLEALGPLLDGKQDASEVLDKLAAILGVGLVVRTAGSFRPRSMDDTATIEWANANGTAGNPAASLADLADSGTGTFKLLTRDAKGRLSGTADGDTDDVPEGVSNLYHTAARVRDTILTGLSTATNAVITATDTVLSALGKLQAQISAHLADTADPHDTVVQTITNGDTTHAPSGDAVFDALSLKAAIPKGYIDGLQMQWVSGTALTVSSGAAYIEASGNIVSAPSDIAKTGLSLTASTWYHVYLYLNAGTPDVEIVTTAPATPYSGSARSKTGDNSRRYVGSVKTDSAGDVFNFLHNDGKISYRTSTGSAPFLVLNNGLATTATVVPCNTVTPVTSRECWLTIVNAASVNARLKESLGTYPVGGRIYGVAAGGYTVLPMPLNASQEFLYEMVSTPPGSGLFAELVGYTFQR